MLFLFVPGVVVVAASAGVVTNVVNSLAERSFAEGYPYARS